MWQTKYASAVPKDLGVGVKSIPKCWVSLTLFCRLGLQRAEMRILATPAWPYLAAVCRGVSPYCGRKNKTERCN